MQPLRDRFGVTVGGRLVRNLPRITAMFSQLMVYNACDMSKPVRTIFTLEWMSFRIMSLAVISHIVRTTTSVITSRLAANDVVHLVYPFQMASQTGSFIRSVGAMGT